MHQQRRARFPHQGFWIGLPVLLMALGAGMLAGCPPLDEPGCLYGGVLREEGSTFPATDGCNTCQCGPDGQVACTLIACPTVDGGTTPGTTPDGGTTPGTTPDGGAKVCSYGGKSYAVGEGFAATDGCNSCACEASGSVVCTVKACAPQAACVRGGCSNHLCLEPSDDRGSTCEYRPEYACYSKAPCERQPDGKCGFADTDSLKQCLANAGGCSAMGRRYAVGDSVPSSDGCNTCSCTAGGVVCTDAACGPGTCAYAGQKYQQGASFPASDGCNTCTCGFNGSVGCTKKACPAPVCDFRASYEFGVIGGLRIYVDRSFLSAGNSYRHVRTMLGGQGGEKTCAPALPACGSQDVITAYDIETHDLPNADVQAALARPTPPLFGRDTRPSDGTVFEFRRADGRGFLVGSPCPIEFSSCQAIPKGIQQLRDRLLALDAQQVASKECQAAGF